jgi:hypothetical protein
MMKKSKAIYAILGVIVVVMVCAMPPVVPAQGAVGIFCNGTGGKESDLTLNLERNGTGDPGKKYFNYLYGLSENKTGKYIFNFSSFWGFKFFSYYRARNTDKWTSYNMENTKQATDKNGKVFNYVYFSIDAPRFSPSQLLVQINAIPYDSNHMLSATVFSYGCSQAPIVGTGCNWVEGSLLGQPTTRWCECNGARAHPSKCP